MKNTFPKRSRWAGNRFTQPLSSRGFARGSQIQARIFLNQNLNKTLSSQVYSEREHVYLPMDDEYKESAMFRKPHKHPQTDQFDVQKIQQHIATINFLADALRQSTQRHHISSHLAVLQQAIKTFEKHRFSDYQFNKTKRAEQVLHTRKIFNELYKHQLKKESSSILARALKHELRDYSTSVNGLISAIQSDLKASLQARHQAEMDQQPWDMLGEDINFIEMEYAVSTFSEALNHFDNGDNEDSFDYFGVTDTEYSDDEYDQKPYLRGSFNFSDEDIQPLLSEIDDYRWSDAEDEMSATDLLESDATSTDNSPAPSRVLSRARLFHPYPQIHSELDIDNSPQSSPRSYR